MPNKQDRKFPIPNIIYSIASKGAAWFPKPFSVGKNKELLEKIREKL